MSVGVFMTMSAPSADEDSLHTNPRSVNRFDAGSPSVATPFSFRPLLSPAGLCRDQPSYNYARLGRPIPAPDHHAVNTPACNAQEARRYQNLA